MGLSQEDLAQLTGVSRQSVTKWETGQSAPDLDRLVEVSDVLGVSLDFLLREPNRFPPHLLSLLRSPLRLPRMARRARPVFPEGSILL